MVQHPNGDRRLTIGEGNYSVAPEKASEQWVLSGKLGQCILSCVFASAQLVGASVALGNLTHVIPSSEQRFLPCRTVFTAVAWVPRFATDCYRYQFVGSSIDGYLIASDRDDT